MGTEVTRREWLMILGRVAGIAGFSGVSPELVAMTTGGHSSSALPPGLYYASQEHLSEALAEPGRMHAIPPGARRSTPGRVLLLSDRSSSRIRSLEPSDALLRFYW